MKKKLLKTLLPIVSGASTIGLMTPALTSCHGDDEKYDVSWNFINGTTFNEFTPSTAEGDLPTDQKDTETEVLSFYLTEVNKNRLLFTDGILNYTQTLLAYGVPPAKGVSATVSVSFISADANKGTVSFKYKKEIDIPNDVILEGGYLVPKQYQLLTCEYTNFPVSLVYGTYPETFWTFQPQDNTTILKQDQNWKFSFKEKFVTKYTNRDANGSYDYNTGETELYEARKYYAGTYFISYYLSKVTLPK